MTLGMVLQAIGVALELVGLGTIMLGISQTRRAFTDKPPLVHRLLTPARWLIARFRKRSVDVIASPASISVTASVGAAGVGTVG